MRKRELQKRWNQLDRACEAIERLWEFGYDKEGYVFGELVSIKNSLESEIEDKTRK